MPDAGGKGRERFFEVAAEQSRFRVVGDSDSPHYTPQQQMWNEFHEWAKSRKTQDFLAIYIARQRAYLQLERESISDHAKLTYYKGHRDLCDYLVEEIRSWAADTPPSGPA